MIIYNMSHLKEVSLYFKSQLRDIFSHNFSATNIREMVARLADCNSYAHLCDELKRHPVVIQYNPRNEKLFEFLKHNHKMVATKAQKENLNDLLFKNPLSLLYAPDCDFPISENHHFYSPEQHCPIPALKKNAIEFVELSSPTSIPKNKYPDLYLDYDCDIEEVISDYIVECVDIGFSWEEVEKKGLSEDEGWKLYEQAFEAWRVKNKAMIDDMRAYALEKTVPYRFGRVAESGAVVENHIIKIDALDEHQALKHLLFKHFSKDAHIVYWRTLQPDTQFLRDNTFYDSFIGTQLIYLGVTDKGDFTPIATSSALTVNLEYSENNMFHVCDAHSATMNDVFKEMVKYLNNQNKSWHEFIDEKLADCMNAVTRLWNSKNIYDDMAVDGLMAKIFSTSFVPVADQYIDSYEFNETTGAPTVRDSCIVFTEVCGPRPKSTIVNIMNAYNFEEIGEEERLEMSDEELAEQKKQLQFAQYLKKVFKKTSTELIAYDPWAHPLS